MAFEPESKKLRSFFKKNVGSSKYTIKKVKRQVADWVEILAKHIPDKKFVFRK